MTRDGFGLMEAIIGGGMLVVVGLGLATMMNFSSRSTQSTKLSIDFNNLVSSIQLVVNQETACRNVFSPFKITPPGGGALPIAINENASPLSNNGSEIARVGSPATGLQVTTLKFNKILDNTLPDVNGKKHYLVNLRLEAKKVVGGGGTAVGGQVLSADFPVSVFTDPATGNITGCYGQNSVSTLSQQVCADWGGIWDPTRTAKCRLPTPAVCGTANGGSASTTAPSAGQLCMVGTASAVSSTQGTSNPWTWTCNSSGDIVNCSQPKLPLYNTSQLTGTGSVPCGWWPNMSSDTGNGCTCMTNQNTSATTCTANSYMTHGNNTASCIFTCNLQQLN